jgi:hypothetical protein
MGKNRDPGSGMGKNQDPGSGIRDKHPGSATLSLTVKFTKIPWIVSILLFYWDNIRSLLIFVEEDLFFL